MARSRVRGTNGKPRKKNKNRDSLRASMHINTDAGTITWTDDNKPVRSWTSNGKTHNEYVDEPHIRNPNLENRRPRIGYPGSGRTTTIRSNTPSNRRRAKRFNNN